MQFSIFNFHFNALDWLEGGLTNECCGWFLPCRQSQYSNLQQPRWFSKSDQLQIVLDHRVLHNDRGIPPALPKTTCKCTHTIAGCPSNSWIHLSSLFSIFGFLRVFYFRGRCRIRERNWEGLIRLNHHDLSSCAWAALHSEVQGKKECLLLKVDGLSIVTPDWKSIPEDFRTWFLALFSF